MRYAVVVLDCSKFVERMETEVPDEYEEAVNEAIHKGFAPVAIYNLRARCVTILDREV